MSQCLGCQRCEIEADTVELIDGRVVCTTCEDWRIECLNRNNEAERLLTLSLEDRQRELAEYERLHGELAGKRMYAEVKRIFESRRAKRA